VEVVANSGRRNSAAQTKATANNKLSKLEFLPTLERHPFDSSTKKTGIRRDKLLNKEWTAMC
jgi:hypothetical protein